MVAAGTGRAQCVVLETGEAERIRSVHRSAGWHASTGGHAPATGSGALGTDSRGTGAPRELSAGMFTTAWGLLINGHKSDSP